MTRGKKGITLMELILVVVVMAVVMAALAPYIGSVQRIWQWGDRRTEMLQHGRVSLDRMVRSLRNCATIVAIDGDTGQGTFIEFTNPDGDQIAYFHNVADNADYYDAGLGDGNLGIRTILASDGSTTTNLLAEAVQSITFKYYRHEMDTSVTPAVAARVPALAAEEVEAVGIEMQMSDPEGELIQTLPVSSFVFCRVISTVSGGEIWVADTGNNQVVKLDSDGVELGRFGGFLGPCSVSANPTDGSCWVADQYNDQIVKLDSNGTELGRFSGFFQPCSVSVNSADGSCWVADFLNNEIVKLDSNGVELGRFGGFHLPLSVSVNPTDGSCWVMDYTSSEIVKLDSNGTELARVLIIEFIGGARPFPGVVSVNPADGSCWVIGCLHYEIVKLDSNGAELGRFSGFFQSRSCAVNPADGSCWVADGGNNQVVKLDSNGAELGRFNGFFLPFPVAVNPIDGSCWIVDSTNEVVKLDSDGTELLRVGGFVHHPMGISVDTGERE